MTNRYDGLSSVSSEGDQEPDEERFTGFDDIDFGTINFEELFGVIESISLEQARFDLDEIEEEPEGVFDMLGKGAEEQREKPELRRHEYPPVNFTAKHRELRDYEKHPVSKGPTIRLYTVNSQVLLEVDGISNVVGATKSKQFEMVIDKKDYMELGIRFGEEVHAKATSLGYSSLIHSVASITIAGKVGILEPVEGFDVFIDGMSFEVTGRNYMKRVTSADVVVNKYPIAYAFSENNDEYLRMIRFSECEDDYDSSYFIGSSIDQGPSPYTPYVNYFHDITRRITKESMHLIYLQMRHYYSMLQPDIAESELIKPNTIELDAAILRGTKVIKGVNKMPSIFFVKSGTPTLDPKMLEVKVLIDTSDYGSTFRNQAMDVDYQDQILARPPQKLLPTFDSANSMYNAGYACCLDYSIFHTIHIEAELLSKITGKEGCFYSKYSHCGISWRGLRSNSLTYYISYYHKGKPDGTYGTWRLSNAALDIWSSPNFKISTSNIEHAKLLPGRVHAMVMAALPYTNRLNRTAVIQRLMLVAACYRHSTWQTSAIAGDFRFITLCSISKTGDIRAMIDKAASKIPTNASCTDMFLAQMLRKFVLKFDSISRDETPIFGLPIRFMSIEKDLPQGMMWHIRGETHATECFKKLSKGVLLEISNRDLVMHALEAQKSYLEKFMKGAVKQTDFNEMMSLMPTIPYYNHVLFMAMSAKSAAQLESGKNQDPTAIGIANMISDHHAIKVETKGSVQGAKISTPRVADGVNDLLIEYGQPKGILQLLSRVTEGEHVHNVFSIHPKDSKSKNREIPQMSNKMRLQQFVQESLLTVYCKSEEAEKMQDENKYPDFVKNFSKIMRSGGKARSEDKEFFCGYMHPEFMSVAYLTVAIVTGSAAIVTSAAIERCNTSRWTVLPKGCDNSVIEGIDERVSVSIKEGKVFRSSLAIKNYVHMQQGVKAIGAAVVTTVVTTGFDLLMHDLLDDIEESVVMTTSDDSGRAVCVRRDSVYQPKQVCNDYINTPPKQTNHFMMVDSREKPIESPSLAEFNNVAAGPNGMFPQSFIHPCLCIQPLLGRSLVEDIVNAVSNARMTITWGDSIDVARSCLDANIILLQQKWLIKRPQLDLLYDWGMIPGTDEEIIRGFSIERPDIALRLLRLISPESYDDVISGDVKLIDGLRKFKSTDPQDNTKVYKVKYEGDLKSVKLAFDSINRSRKVKKTMKIQHTKQLTYNKRVALRDLFFDELIKPCLEATPREIEVIEQLRPRCKVQIIPTPARRKDFLPCDMGSSVKIRTDVNIKSIISMRLFGIISGQVLSESEREIVKYDDETFNKWLLDYKSGRGTEGMRFSSAGGRPLMSAHNDVFYKKSMTFNFEYYLPDSVAPTTNFTIGGRYYAKVEICHYGGGTLNKASREGSQLAFGYSVVGSQLHIFYMTHKCRPKVYIVDHVPDFHHTFHHHKTKVFCPLRKDLSAIVDGTFDIPLNSYYNPLFAGDTTALLNYGSYINSSSRGAISTMHKIFKHFNSSFPHYISKLKHNYPHFPEDAVEVPMSKVNYVVGYKCIARLKLVMSDRMQDMASIDLTGTVPVATSDFGNEEEIIWG